jgi:hypothetical protein
LYTLELVSPNYQVLPLFKLMIENRNIILQGVA